IISSSRDLLVLGGGAGGVTAAIRAAQLGIKTTLVEASHHCFGRQKGCTTRWVDPTQYDWPADHWDRGVYPWAPPAMPLPWAEQISSVIAAVWEREFRRARARYPNLTFLPLTTVRSIVYSSGARLAVMLSGSVKPASYGAVLICVGFGMEKASLRDYRSFQFWDSDLLESAGLGRTSIKRVLIAGGGDGALQDFLRITTGMKSARELLKSLPADAQALVSSAIHSAEDQAQRAGIWCERRHEHAVFKRLQKVYLDQVTELLKDAGVEKALDDALLNSKAFKKITLAYPCDHFSRCYGLNRLLVLLIIKHAAAKGLVAFEDLASTGVKSVIGVSHACSKSAAACHGQEHEVSFEAFPLCASPAGAATKTEIFDAVILRLGVTPPAPFAGSPLLFTRQILPYHASQ
ncbi:MAG: FAD-dependent oxidoreductase, partial [Bryobacteraceae bacterium]